MKNCKKIKTTDGGAPIGEKLNFASKEAYNRLRTNVLFSLVEDGAKVVGISSACPQEGKSTVSMNLAYSLGEAGYKVLLIDADMRRPSICTTLELPRALGLSNALTSDQEIPLHKDILHENVSIMTSGDIPPNPSELIGSVKMRDLINKFKAEFDYIIVDLSPILAVSDTIAVSKYIDGVIIVVKHGSTKRREIVEVVRQLRYANAKILGFVYNKIARGTKGKKDKYGYYVGSGK